MNSTLNKIVLNLLEACVTLYPADNTGAPVLGSPIWLGSPAEKLSVRERWRIKETTTTGAKHPRKRPLIPDYDIAISRVWLLDVADLTGWSADWQQYVLDVVWTDEDTGDWHRRTFYGVTIGGERGLDSRDIDNGFTDDQAFAAQYFIPSSGTGTAPAITSSLPYTVRFTGTDGVAVLLYNYDPGTHQFTAAADTANRATLAYVGYCFTATFAPNDLPSLQCLNSPAAPVYRTPGKPYRSIGSAYRGGAVGLFVPALDCVLPPPTELPRLEFFYGAQRVATLTPDGLYDTRFTQAMPADGVGKFALYAGSTLMATLAAGEVQAQDFIVW